MNTNQDPTPAERQYDAAHAIPYAGHDPEQALRSYDLLSAQHHNAPEADCARAQFDNSVNLVVLAAELLAAKLALVLRALRPAAPTPIPVRV